MLVNVLEHHVSKVAGQIYKVFQASYQIEADLIGVENFPPLSRSTEDIKNSDTVFYGCFEGDTLAAVIETKFTAGNQTLLKICSLTVEPKHFRKGIASQLIQFVFDLYEAEKYVVETAVINKPAIGLYEKHGFTEYKQYLPDHGIPKVVMRFEP